MRVLVLDVTGRVTWSGGQTWSPARLLADDHGRTAVWEGGRGLDTPVWKGHTTVTASAGQHQVTLAAGDGTRLDAVREGCGCGTRLSALGEMDLAKLGLVVPA